MAKKNVRFSSPFSFFRILQIAIKQAIKFLSRFPPTGWNGQNRPKTAKKWHISALIFQSAFSRLYILMYARTLIYKEKTQLGFANQLWQDDKMTSVTRGIKKGHPVCFVANRVSRCLDSCRGKQKLQLGNLLSCKAGNIRNQING